MTANSWPSEQERAPDYPSELLCLHMYAIYSCFSDFLQEWVSEENEDFPNTFAGQLLCQTVAPLSCSYQVVFDYPFRGFYTQLVVRDSLKCVGF